MTASLLSPATSTNPVEMIRPRRKITGISAILLPFENESGKVDWDGLRNHVARTAQHGVAPAVNMDTGYANLIDEATRREVLRQTQDVLDGGEFVAGAFVADSPGDPFDFDAYRQQLDQILEFGGTPIIFQSYGLTQQSGGDIVDSYAQIGAHGGEFIAFELGQMFAPFGKIYDLDTYAGLLDVAQCTGAKHSSLSRQLEWQRLTLRDERRPDFKVYTGNDLASTWSCTAATTCSASAPSPPISSPSAMRCGPRATPASTSSTTCCNISASSPSDSPSPPTNTAPPNCSSSAAGSIRTCRTPMPNVARRAMLRCCGILWSGWHNLKNRMRIGRIGRIGLIFLDC